MRGLDIILYPFARRITSANRRPSPAALMSAVPALLLGALAPGIVDADGSPDILWMAGGHDRPITCITYSSDGQILASIDVDATVKIWRTSDGLLLRSYRHGGRCIALSPDGCLLAVGVGNLIHVWHVDDGRLAHLLTAEMGDVASVAFSPDGQVLASGSIEWHGPGGTRLWRMVDGKLLRTLPDTEHSIYSLAFSPGGDILASGSADCSVHLWRVSDGELLRTLQGHTELVRSVAYSPDGQAIASGSYDDTIRVWRTSDGELLMTLAGHTDDVCAVDISPHGSFIASGSRDTTVRLWRMSDGELVQTIEGFDHSVDSVAFSPDGAALASAARDTIIEWSVPEGLLLRALTDSMRYVSSVALSPDGQALAAATCSGLRMKNARDGSTLWSSADGLNTVAFSPDGEKLASGDRDTTAKLWRASNGELLQTFEGHSRAVQSVDISPDGSILATGSLDQTIKLWRLADGGLIRTLADSSPVTSVAFSPDGRILATANFDPDVKLWRVADGELLHTLTGHTGHVWSLAFSPDGHMLASGGSCDWDWVPDSTIRLWRVSDGELLRTLTGHDDLVYSVSFSPDGQILASGGAWAPDNQYASSIKLWHVSDGTLLHTYEQETGSGVMSAAFSPDGALFAYGRVDAVLAVARAPGWSSAGEGSFVPGWVWFSIPLKPTVSADASDVLGFDCTNRLYGWDDAFKLLRVYPYDFADLEVGPSYVTRLALGEAYAPAYLGTHPGAPFERTLPAPGWCWLGVPGTRDINSLDLSVRKDEEIRSPDEDQHAPDPWLNWNWIFWDPTQQVYGLMDPFGASDDTRVHPWWGYRVWVNTGDVTIVFP